MSEYEQDSPEEGMEPEEPALSESAEAGQDASSVIVRDDGRQFVVGAIRESLPAALPKRSKISRVTTLRDTHETICLAGYSAGAQSHYIFANAQGYALGEHARDHFKPKGQRLWIEPVDENQTLVVVMNSEEVVTDCLIQNDEEELPLQLKVALMAAGEEVGANEELVMSHYGDAPANILAMLYGQEINCVLDELDEKLLPKIRPDKRYRLTPFSDSLRSLTTSKGPGLPTKLVGVAVVIALLASLFFVFKGEETVVRVIDRYSSYRSHLSQPTASSILEELFVVMQAAQSSDQWLFEGCEYDGGNQLLCELSSRPGARASSLELLPKIIGREVSTTLIENAAIATIHLNTQPRQGDYIITNRQSAVTAVRDRLNVASHPTSISIQSPAVSDNWSRQAIMLQYPETGLHTLLQMSTATRRFPAHLTSARMDWNNGEYDIEAVISVFGAR
ncbi:hypothetical protein [Marinimicrobium sp. ABcell2]|uniref:hypothetical protein n=1 Tax=Marinimicrobium sp. ABcell2 TaxID=3069751 RepID=UPI0027B622B6|nr:hypothetical protein [Marinimicrobium sp. ABcell2]MDQ2077388.1 hypothetical protein [Marinimicrobium sp. ABcell2]